MRCRKARTKQLELPLMKNNFIARIKEILKLIDMIKARVSFFPEYNPPLYVTGVHGQTNQATYNSPYISFIDGWYTFMARTT